MELKEKIDALDELMTEMNRKKELLGLEYEYAKDIQEGIECIEEQIKGPQIGIFTDSFGEEVNDEWEFGLMMVDREDFLSFLKAQRDKHIAAADKLVDEVFSHDTH